MTAAEMVITLNFIYVVGVLFLMFRDTTKSLQSRKKT